MLHFVQDDRMLVQTSWLKLVRAVRAKDEFKLQED